MRVRDFLAQPTNHDRKIGGRVRIANQRASYWLGISMQPDKTTTMTRDLDRTIAGLKRHRASAERSVTQFHENGSHQDAEQLRIDFAQMEKIFECMIMAAADAEGPNKKH
jgi:hypothetical protein